MLRSRTSSKRGRTVVKGAGPQDPPCRTSTVAPEPSPDSLWAGIGAYGRWVDAAFESIKRQEAQDRSNLQLRLERQSMSLEDLTARQVRAEAEAQSQEVNMCSSVPPGGWAADDSPHPTWVRPPWAPPRGECSRASAGGRLRGAVQARKPLKPTSKPEPRPHRLEARPKTKWG